MAVIRAKGKLPVHAAFGATAILFIEESADNRRHIHGAGEMIGLVK